MVSQHDCSKFKAACQSAGDSAKSFAAKGERWARLATLTPREYQAFLILLEGYSLKRSAEAMGVKYPTMSTYASAVSKKLKVNCRSELIIKYLSIALECKTCCE